LVFPRGLDRRVWQLAIARAVNTAGLSLVLAFLGVYIVEDRGYPAIAYGIIALVANLGQSLSNAWAGAFSDRMGRRLVITGSLFARGVVIAALGTLVLLDAPLIPLGIAIVLSAMLRGCFEPVSYALVADVVPSEQRIAAFGLQRMGTNLGWAMGPAIGGSLSLLVPYGVIFYVSAASMIGAAVITLRIHDPAASLPTAARTIATPEPTTLLRSLRDAMTDPSLRLLLLGTFLAAMLQTQMFSTFSIFMTDRVGVTKAQVGLLYAFNGALVLVLQLPAMRLIQRRGVRAILPWAAVLSSVGFSLVALGSFRGGVLAIFVITCAEMLFAPSHQTTVAELSLPGARGRMFGVIGLAQMVGVACAPLLGGALLDTIGGDYLALWLTLATLGIGQTWCFVRFARPAPSPAVPAAALVDSPARRAASGS
jgi:predicted MFS family arabinose efflux permease